MTLVDYLLPYYSCSGYYRYELRYAFSIPCYLSYMQNGCLHLAKWMLKFGDGFGDPIYVVLNIDYQLKHQFLIKLTHLTSKLLPLSILIKRNKTRGTFERISKFSFDPRKIYSDRNKN